MPGGRLVFDVFAPRRDDIEETHGRWLEREPGIFERADWDEEERTLTLSVRGGEEASTMLLAGCRHRSGDSCSTRPASRWRRGYGWFDRRPYGGGEDMVFVADAP